MHGSRISSGSSEVTKTGRSRENGKSHKASVLFEMILSQSRIRMKQREI